MLVSLGLVYLSVGLWDSGLNLKTDAVPRHVRVLLSDDDGRGVLHGAIICYC